MAKEPTIRHYRLKRPFWDNMVMQPKGTVLPFPEGGAPSSAILLTQAEVEALSLADKAAAAVEVQLPEGFYADVVAEVTAKVLAAIGQEDAVVEANADKTDSAEGGSTPADTKAKK
jgi:hypothetical protein